LLFITGRPMQVEVTAPVAQIFKAQRCATQLENYTGKQKDTRAHEARILL